MKRNILIFGASGKTGHELVNQALAQGHHVTAFVRNPSKLKITHDNLKVVLGDITNYQNVVDAIKGHDAVLSALGAASPYKFDQSVIDGMSNIVRVMEQVGIKRLIYLSGIVVDESRRNAGLLIRCLAPFLLRTEKAGHEARENIIRQSMLNWTLVRSAALTDGEHKTIYRSGENIKAQGILASISRADVADFMLRQLTDNNFIKRTPITMY